jgi:hypothetical protein
MPDAAALCAGGENRNPLPPQLARNRQRIGLATDQDDRRQASRWRRRLALARRHGLVLREKRRNLDEIGAKD